MLPELKEQLKEIGMAEPTIEDLKNQFNNWPHQDSKKIIIARIPTKYINKAGDRSDLDGEMFGAFYTQKRQPNGQETNYLDSKFIVGCFDVDKQAVRLNKNFERTLTLGTIKKLENGYRKTLVKTNARKERQAFGITQEEVNLAAQQHQEQVVDNNPVSYSSFDNIEWSNPLSEQEQINQLKEQIANYNNQINTFLANMQPYMRIPKVSREISKVIEKNDEINSSEIIDSLQDYKTVVGIKQTLVSYLEKADKFIKDNVGKKQEQGIEQQSVWSLNPTETLPDNFWDEFDNPNNNRNARPEKIYNDDGTYTMEYISYLANTPLGFNEEIYNQLMQSNAMKKQQNVEQMTSNGIHK